MEENVKPRSIDELIDLPYSEMTEDEIALVVDFKAACKSRDEMHGERMRLIAEQLNEMAQVNLSIAQQAQSQLDRLTAHAIARFESETIDDEQ